MHHQSIARLVKENDKPLKTYEKYEHLLTSMTIEEIREFVVDLL